MGKAFGTTFRIVNQVQQPLDPKVFGGGPWIHLATVTRGFKEYMAFKQRTGQQAWVEEVDPTSPGLLKKIEDAAEWEDLVRFLLAAKLLEIGTRKEMLIAVKD